MKTLRKHLSNNKNLLILVVILFFALALRTVHLTSNPIGLNQDEAVNGYDAYVLGKTLMDHHGHFLPPLLESFQDWGSTFLTYFTIPFVQILGLSVGSIRLATVVLGVGSIGLFYIFLRQISLSQRLALLGAFLLAIQPWHITLSRWALPPSAVPFTLLLFLVTFLWAIKVAKNRRDWVFVLPAITAGMLTYSYQTERLFAPLFVFVVALIYLRKHLVSFFIFLTVFAIVVSPIYILTLTNPSISSSFHGLSIFWRPDPLVAFVNGYIGFFLPYFHFQAGDPNIMHHVPGIGSSYDFLSLFFYLGIILCIGGVFNRWRIEGIEKSTYYLILAWTFLFPVPASLTFYPTVLRVIHGMPLAVLFFIVSLSFLQQSVKKSTLFLLYAVIIGIGLVETNSFMKIYLNEYPKSSFKEFQYGIGDFTNYLLDHEDDFDKVVIDNSINKPYIYYLFYSKLDPGKLNYTDPEKSSQKYIFSFLPTFDTDDKNIIHEVRFGETVLYKIYANERVWYVKKM